MTSRKLKVGDRAVANASTLDKHPSFVTKGKTYVVEAWREGDFRVISDRSPQFFSSVDTYFTLIIFENEIGGELL